MNKLSKAWEDAYQAAVRHALRVQRDERLTDGERDLYLDSLAKSIENGMLLARGQEPPDAMADPEQEPARVMADILLKLADGASNGESGLNGWLSAARVRAPTIRYNERRRQQRHDSLKGATGKLRDGSELRVSQFDRRQDLTPELVLEHKEELREGLEAVATLHNWMETYPDIDDVRGRNSRERFVRMVDGRARNLQWLEIAEASRIDTWEDLDANQRNAASGADRQFYGRHFRKDVPPDIQHLLTTIGLNPSR